MQPWVYVVLLGAAAIGYALMLPARRQSRDKKDNSIMKEAEAALELYMADIERENNELLEVVGNLKAQMSVNQASFQGKLDELHTRLEDTQKRYAELEARVAAGEAGMLQLALAQNKAQPAGSADSGSGNAVPEASNEEAKEATKAKPVSSIKLRYPRLFELEEEGKSIDAISKATGLQRGEVQLILQLAKQEESV